jgi:tRNA pseudouridine55 synthase
MSISIHNISSNQSQKSGFLLINKPSGPTSHDIIYQLRKITGIKKIGHAGTLDPFASGLLLVAIGDATKLLQHYVGLDKTYKATLKLGAEADTYDRTGNIAEQEKDFEISKSKLEAVLKSFLGKQHQAPPMYSAKKVKGKKLYEHARAGKTIKRKQSEITIQNIKLVSRKKIYTAKDEIKIICTVTSGTYIRTLAHDIGKKLKCGAYVEELRRTSIGGFKLKDAVATNNLTKTNWHKYLEPMKTVLVSGTFDGVHEGHKNYFQQARKLGHKLICIVARASVVKKIKGEYPRLDAKKRIKLVKQCTEIDQVFLGTYGKDGEIYNFVAQLKPDVIALGYDQKAYTKNLKREMKRRGLRVKVIRLNAYKPHVYKSSIIIDKTKEKS